MNKYKLTYFKFNNETKGKQDHLWFGSKTIVSAAVEVLRIFEELKIATKNEFEYEFVALRKTNEKNFK